MLMGINWRNIINDQARGMNPASAFYKEERRRREEAAKECERRIEENRKRRTNSR